MTKSIFSLSFFYFTASLLVLLAASSATASAGNVTSGLGYDGCVPGNTVGECITAVVKEEYEEGIEAVMRRLGQQQKYLGYQGLQKHKVCEASIKANCMGIANTQDSVCTYYQKCKRSP